MNLLRGTAMILTLAFGCTLGALGAFARPSGPAKTQPGLQKLTTPSGVSFGIWSAGTTGPAPTLFILASTIDETLGDPYFRQSGTALAEQAGFICVSIDLPAHGAEHRADERAGLEGWRDRADRDEDFVAANNARLRAVLDYLVAEGYTDPARIVACGTSRGGYLALQFTAAEPRVRAVAAFAPVTDLTALREFKGAEASPLVQRLSVIRQADALANRPVWVVIGDRDTRVGTDDAIAFARAVTNAALRPGGNPRVELHVLPEPKGHTTPHGAPAAATAWLLAQCPPSASP